MAMIGTVQQLDPSRRSPQSEEFEAALRRRIIGQEEAVQAVADLYQVFRAGLNAPGRPVGNLLFLGPTGSGKTRIVEAAAEVLFGDPRAFIKVDCGEFQHSHEIAKLIGSPPGYLGHRETHPLITQEGLAQYHTEDLKLSFVLFDEIEKASDALWRLLLGVLDKATLTLGDNRRVDLSQTAIFMTSNLGAAEMNSLLFGGFGFGKHEQTRQGNLHRKLEGAAIEAARRKFSPEFINRLDRMVVFHPLGAEQLDQVLDIELDRLQQRLNVAASGWFALRILPEARAQLLEEGADLRYGARHLRRALERCLVYPLAGLLATHQVQPGDAVLVGWDDATRKMVFHRQPQTIPAVAAGVASRRAA